MLDTLPSALQGLGRQVLPTLPSLSQEDVSTIWGYVSEFVERQLTLHKGVHIPGLGIFTFMRQKLDMGSNKFILIQRPIFILAEKLVQLHGLTQNKVHTPGDIPIIPLNFITISLEGPYNRDIVEGCVKETLLFLSRSIATQRNVEFTFKGIGVLMIRHGKVKMRFFKDFLCAMDGSGTLMKALVNRPGTVDSVLSSREDHGKRPYSVLAFPRISLKETENKPPLETIVEESQDNRKKLKVKEKSDNDKGIKEISPPKNCRDRQAISPAKVTGVNLTDTFGQTKSGARNMSESLEPPGFLKCKNDKKPQTSPVHSCQDHKKAGQEMCYVCLQRAQQNSPLYYGEVRKRRELEDEQLLRQYQTMKEQEAFVKQQMNSLVAREQNQKNAAYNLGVADAIRNHKNEKPEFYKSCIFDKRPLSSEINAYKQEEYSRSLLKQIDNRREKEIKQRLNRDLMDRLEQVQFTEELAAQRAKYLKDKMEESQCYKRALDTQIKNKPFRLPVFEPDSTEPIFGKPGDELLMERRNQEQNYMKHQLETAAAQKRKVILNQMADQRRDLQMLERTHKEFLQDRAAERERENRITRGLQDDWERSVAMKRQRDQEEKVFERASDKLFLLDQCEKYERCKQCQRRTSNMGQSNLWPGTKHLHGSRLFV
ncbi:coiled-coil domain-containing protein 81 [Echinops telfairi]|uniref:Coiled-coil domain-containing protein 81 n=1 Tax=Echinops telfairi TaxID=9371 RepID=A0ABM0IVZ5_ECHTE|nr:coiled-coil domain-containing protein 81 [Echinops telfairi]